MSKKAQEGKTSSHCGVCANRTFVAFLDFGHDADAGCAGDFSDVIDQADLAACSMARSASVRVLMVLQVSHELRDHNDIPI